MTNVTPLFVDHLSPLELRRQQDETMLAARRWLNPAQLAALLMDRSRNDLRDALNELLKASGDTITCWIEAGEMNAWDRDKAVRYNAQTALCVLIDHFGIEVVREYIAIEYEDDGNAG